MYRLPFSIVSRAHIVAPTVLGSPIAFVERGVGRASGRSEASPVVSVVLAHAASLVRTIYVVREEFAVPGRLAYRLLGGPPGPENAGAHELREMLGSTPEQWQA